MSHRFFFLLFLLASPSSEAFAQGGATVAGRVLDMANQTPVGYATVVIENATTGTSLSGALAGEDGRFVVQGLTPGTYKFRVTFPGFLEAETDVLVSPLNNTYDLGDIRLPRIEGYKEEVSVTADTIRLAGIDTQVFKMDDGPSQSTGTVLDAMKNLPGVTVDEEGHVSLRGSDKVAILIDGRQSSLTGFGSQRGLDAVSAANIEAIEIINNPSARFDAAGMAGIINIIYRKEQQVGWSGDAGF